jgi:hypothetical protein
MQYKCRTFQLYHKIKIDHEKNTFRNVHKRAAGPFLAPGGGGRLGWSNLFQINHIPEINRSATWGTASKAYSDVNSNSNRRRRTLFACGERLQVLLTTTNAPDVCQQWSQLWNNPESEWVSQLRFIIKVLYQHPLRIRNLSRHSKDLNYSLVRASAMTFNKYSTPLFSNHDTWSTWTSWSQSRPQATTNTDLM